MTERQLQNAVRRYADAREQRDAAIQRASAEGMTYRRIAEVVGLSLGRVQQIVRGATK